MPHTIFLKHGFREAAIIEEIKSFSEDQLLKAKDPKKGFNYLHAAAYFSLQEVLLFILTKTNGDGLNTQDLKGRTPIHHLASNGQTAILKTIFELYKDRIKVNLSNCKGRTALHSAAKWLHTETVKLLIANGAELYLVDIQGHTPLSLTYHRHFTGYDSEDLFQHDVITILKEKTTYWSRSLKLKELVGQQNYELLLAWYLGIRYAGNPNWIPGVKLGALPYVIEKVHHTALAEFILIGNENEAIVLCFDRIPMAQRAIYYSRHFELAYYNELITLSCELQKFNVSKIWGVELAGIDAQILASRIPVQQLILINSPGMPKNPVPASMEFAKCEPKQCQYFFSALDKLHDKGRYWWAGKATMYTDQSTVESFQDASPLLRSRLEESRRQVLLKDAPKMVPLTTGYKPSDDEVLLPPIVPVEDAAVRIQKLFDDTTKAMLAINEAGDDLSNKEHLLNFARYEHCAHNLAYEHFPHELEVSWWPEGSKATIYRIIHHHGLYCYLVKTSTEWMVAFQGTDFSDLGSALRDLDRGSAGIKRIRQQYSTILHRLSEHLEQQDTKIKLVVCGHSLGGGDAQNFFTALLASLAQFKRVMPDAVGSAELKKFMARASSVSTNILDAIAEVHLYSYNGAGIRKSTADLAVAAARQLAGSIPISINHQVVRHDVVNTVGEVRLDHFDVHDASSKSAAVHLVVFPGHDDFATRVATAHTDRQFSGGTEIKPLGFFTNYSAEKKQNMKDGFKEHAPKLEPNESTLFQTAKRVLQTQKSTAHMSPSAPTIDL